MAIKTLLLLLAGALLGGAAEDPWLKVKNLKSGTEVRIVRDRVRQPILGKVDELTQDNLLIVVKNEQVAIPRSEIERIDARPLAGRVRTESVTSSDPDASKPPLGPPAAGPGRTTTSSSVSVGSKPDFETVYRRLAGKK